MQVFLDHITAVLVGGGVILALAATWVITSQTSTQAGMTYQARAVSGEVIAIIDRDLRNIGSGVPPSEAAVTGFDWTGAARSFEFRATVSPEPDAPVEWIRYVVEAAPAGSCGRAGDCLTFTRHVWDGSAFRPTGPQGLPVTRFDLSATPLTGSLDEIRELDIAVAFDARGTAQGELAWSSRYYLLGQVIRAHSH
jgi:hypothetical protein